MRRLVYSPNGWLDYIYWQKSDKQMQKHIDKLSNEICKSPFKGIGDPIQLKFDLQNIWTRRLDLANRLVYRVSNETIEIIQCRFHY